MSFVEKAAKNIVGATGLGALFGVNPGADAAEDAARLQAGAAGAGIEEQRRQFDITTGQLTAAEQANRAALDPFAQAGLSALQQQQALLGLGTPEQQQAAFASLSESPGQRFVRERAEKATLRNAAATGQLGGGGVKAELARLGAGFASQLENQQFNRLAQLSGQGLSAASGIGSGAIGTAARQGQFGSQLAGNVSNLLGQQSQARASGILGAQQAQTDQFGNLISLGTSSLFSDKKLKENIKKIGVVNGFNWYSWTWNKLAEKIGLHGDSTGVIANEVKEVKPKLVTKNKNGYLMVNYSGLGV